MKKSIVILIFFITLGAKAQGNLQYNRVITDAGYIATNGCSNDNSPTYTVPVGKVWKIESFAVITSKNYFVLNGNLIIPSNYSPIWLKEGDSFYFSTTGVCNVVSNSFNWFFSAIEFNITQ